MISRFSLVQKFSKPAYLTLVDWINEKNNRGFSLDQFVFNGVTPINDNGDCRIAFKFSDKTGWPQDEQLLVVQRVDISNVPGLAEIVIHSPEFTKVEILKSIFDQYGLYLDADLVRIVPARMPLKRALLNKYLDGFDESSDPKKTVIDNTDRARDFQLEILSEHPTLTGFIPLFVRKSLSSHLGNVDSLMDLREYYVDGREDLPFVENIQPRGLWLVKRELYTNERVYKGVCNALHAYADGDVLLTDTFGASNLDILLDIMREVTKRDWVVDGKASPFNLHSATVTYNGLTDPVVNTAPIEYNHMLVIELSNLCDNLQGTVRIAYKYASPHHPISRNRAGILPIS